MISFITGLLPGATKGGVEEVCKWWFATRKRLLWPFEASAKAFFQYLKYLDITDTQNDKNSAKSLIAVLRVYGVLCKYSFTLYDVLQDELSKSIHSAGWVQILPQVST